jgi:hypothetical protein
MWLFMRFTCLFDIPMKANFYWYNLATKTCKAIRVNQRGICNCLHNTHFLSSKLGMRDNHLITSKSHSSSSVSFKNPDSTFSCSGIAGSVTLRCLLFLVNLDQWVHCNVYPLNT